MFDEHYEADLIAKNDSMARSVALRYGGPRNDGEDLIQSARIGMLEAIRNFDASKGASLQTHMYNGAIWAVMHHTRADTGVVHIPYEVLCNKNDEARALIPQRVFEENDATVFAGGEFVESVNSRLLLHGALSKLPVDKRTAVWLYHVEMHSVTEIASMMKLPNHAIYRLIKSAIQILRRWFISDNISVSMLRQT